MREERSTISFSAPPSPHNFFPSATALTIAGSDPSGGAGLQADLKTFQQLGVYGMSVVTLLTVQNTQGVKQVEVVPMQLIEAQSEAVLSDIPPRAIKTGALGNAEVIEVVSKRLNRMEVPIVIDPVLVSKHGHSLVTEDVVQAFKEHLLPLAYLVTPNRYEAELLTGMTLNDDASVREAIQRLRTCGARYVLIKLGEVDGQSQHWLSVEGENLKMPRPRLRSRNTHGTGCILSAAITAKLALGETDVAAAVDFGIQKAFEAVQVDTRLGKGIHPAEIRAMSG